MDKRAKQIRNKAQYRMDQLAKLRMQIQQIDRELVLLEVEYEELEPNQRLFNRDRTQLAPIEQAE